MMMTKDLRTTGRRVAAAGVGRCLLGRLSLVVVTTVMALMMVPTANASSESASSNSDEDGNGNKRGQLYSTAAFRRFCSEAQEIIATTDLVAEVDLFDALLGEEGFFNAKATPYRGKETLPLVIPGHIVRSTDEDNKEYVQGILCKMKSADGLNDAYQGLGAIRTDCNAVNQEFYARVVNSLTNSETEVITANDIEFDRWVAYSGPQWTDDIPAPFAYTSSDGKLHFVGKELYVNVNFFNPFFDIPPELKGVHYCQVPSAEYMRRLITGEITAPTCDAPPAYDPRNPDGLQSWECQNPTY